MTMLLLLLLLCIFWNRLAKGEIDAAESDLAVALIAFPKDVGVKHDINKLAEKRKLHVAKVSYS
jgi:hypothetical protein